MDWGEFWSEGTAIALTFPTEFGVGLDTTFTILSLSLLLFFSATTFTSPVESVMRLETVFDITSYSIVSAFAVATLATSTESGVGLEVSFSVVLITVTILTFLSKTGVGFGATFKDISFLGASVITETI